MPSTGGVGKRAKDEKKTKLQHGRAEKQKDADATKQELDALQKTLQALVEQVKHDPAKQEEVATMEQRIQEVQAQLNKNEQETDAIERQEKELESMEVYDDDTGDASPANQAPGSINQAGEDKGPHNKSNLGGDDNDTNKESSADHETNNSNPAKTSPPPSIKEDAELPMMTVDYYKNMIGSPTTACEVVAWKPKTRMRGQVVINRYGPKSHPKFRIETASQSFDENLPNLMKEGYRIGELKNEDGDWLYNYQNVAGILGVAFKVRDHIDPLRAIDPAHHGKGQRYTETQVWIQWKGIKGSNPNPRSWEVRGTAQRVCPIRTKGAADKMIFARAKECEESFETWFQGDSQGRDKTMSPAPLIKIEKAPEVEDQSVNGPSEVINEATSKEKATQPKETSPVSTTSPASVEPVASAWTSTQAVNPPPFDTQGWLADYESVFGPKNKMNPENRAMMMTALREAKSQTK